MITSESIKNISPALLAAQKLTESAVKDSKNPFFRSSYADVNSVIDACKEHLNANGIFVSQPVESDGTNNYVVTRFQHTTGEFMESKMLLLPVKNMQELGSAITYGRRYSLQSWMLMSAIDDDANLASGKNDTKQQLTAKLTPKVVESTPYGKPINGIAPGGFQKAVAQNNTVVKEEEEF